MVFNNYQKQRILYHYLQSYRAPTIHRLVQEEMISASRYGIAKFIKKFEETGCITKLPGSGCPSKIMAVKAVVDRWYRISLWTVLRCRTSLGWTFRGSAYCQLIREANMTKRLLWAQQYLNDSFENVVWTDECSVQLETHRRFCCRKRGEPPTPKPRYYSVVAYY